MNEHYFQRLREKLPGGYVLEAGESKDDLARADIVILNGGSFGKEEFEQAAKLKLLQLTWSNNPQVDLDYAASKDVPVAGAFFMHSIGVAEHTILLMLALARRLITGDNSVRDQDKYPPCWNGVEGLGFSFAYNWPHIGGLVHLKGKTLGLMGLGSIGVEVARLAGAFGMQVLYWKKTPLPPIYENQLGVSYCEFKQLLQRSDFVSLHLSLNEETRGIFGRDEFSIMKNTAYFINTARGLMVDEEPLCAALKDHQIAGAALDVYNQEPLPTDSPLLSAPNLILTPHYASGFDSYEHSQEHITGAIMNNIMRLSQGQQPQNILNGVIS